MKKEEIEEATDLTEQLRLIAKCLPDSPFKEKVKEVTEAAITALRSAEQRERERCAKIAEAEARLRDRAGTNYPEDSSERARCFSAARACQIVAAAIRGKEEGE